MSEIVARQPPENIRDLVPRRLRPRHLCALFDERPSVIRYWLDSGLLPSQQRGFGRHRWVDPADVIAFALEEGMSPARLDWIAAIEVDFPAANQE